MDLKDLQRRAGILNEDDMFGPEADLAHFIEMVDEFISHSQAMQEVIPERLANEADAAYSALMTLVSKLKATQRGGLQKGASRYS